MDEFGLPLSQPSPSQQMGSWFAQDPREAAAIYRDTQVGDAAARQSQPLTGWAKGLQNFGTLAQGLSGLGSMYLGFQNMKQQKKEFNFNKGIINTNMANSIMDYNRRLGDTLANRSLNNGKGDSWAAAELAKYSAKRA